jgi:hypothetical protein
MFWVDIREETLLKWKRVGLMSPKRMLSGLKSVSFASNSLPTSIRHAVWLYGRNHDWFASHSRHHSNQYYSKKWRS